jgi:hypothetical protein
VCWKPCSSCWSFDLLREEFLSAPIHSPPPLWFAVSVLHAAAATSSCYGPVATAVSCGGSPIATALAAARGALDERRLVITGTPDLSALAIARAGMIGVTLRMKKHKDEHQSLKIKGARGKRCSPQVGEASLHLPRGFGGCRCCTRRRRRGICRRLRGARGLLH